MIGSFDTLLDEEEDAENGLEDAPPEEDVKITDEMTPKQLAATIRALVLASRMSASRREKIHKKDLLTLCQWEREVTNNYGVNK